MSPEMDRSLAGRREEGVTHQPELVIVWDGKFRHGPMIIRQQEPYWLAFANSVQK